MSCVLLGHGGAWAADVPASGGARSTSASARTSSVLVPASADQRALALELGTDGLWLRVCAEASCAARSGRRLELPAAARVSEATLEVLEIAPGRRAVHARVPTRDAAWEALLAAGIGGTDPLILFAGITGAVSGEDGSRQGDMLWIRESGHRGRRVLLGRVREDVQLCGRPSILEPLLLDRDLALRPAKVQRLSLEERRGARVLTAHRHGAAPTPGGNALRALAASSGIGDPQFLTDGRPETSWAEGRGGDGRGEFVVLRPLSGSALVALEFLIPPEGDAPASAAPRSLWLATRGSLFRVDFPEDARHSPGVWYRTELPGKLSDDCLALVLESSYASGTESQLGFAEVRGVSELQGLQPAELVARLSTPGEEGARAVPALLQAGVEGVQAVVGAFGALDALGRSRALDVLEGGPCDLVAGVYTEVLVDEDARRRRRAERRLRGCGEASWGELRQAFERSIGAAGVRLGHALGDLAPALAVELLAPRLLAAPPAQRVEYRGALRRAARYAEAQPGLRRLLANHGFGAPLDLELLRALSDLLGQYQPEAAQCFARAAAAARTFERRYVLLGPATALAAQDDPARAFLRRALQDPDPYLRAAAVRSAPALAEFQPALFAATRDPEVRVRDAGVQRLGELALPAAESALRERVREDRWPLVRASAVQALAALRPAPELDTALLEALEDDSPLVRAAAVRGLGRRGAKTALPALLARLEDAEEAAPVRTAAAHALAQLCDPSAVDALTRAVRRLAQPGPSQDDVLVGAAALSALGRLQPADLEHRLAPLAGVKNQPVLKELVAAARQSSERCTASVLPARNRAR